jgi:hypothetical protein
MLEAAEKYWPLAQGYSSHYRKRSYNNKPKDIKALRTSLDAMTLESSNGNTGTTKATRATLNESLVHRLAGKIAKEQNPKEAASTESESACTSANETAKATTNKIPSISKNNRGRRHSDSFCVAAAPNHRPVLARVSSLQGKTFPNIQCV